LKILYLHGQRREHEQKSIGKTAHTAVVLPARDETVLHDLPFLVCSTLLVFMWSESKTDLLNFDVHYFCLNTAAMST
jgi:hypothetical protein